VPPFNFELTMKCAAMDEVRFATFTAFLARGAKSDVGTKILVRIRIKKGCKILCYRDKQLTNNSSNRCNFF
jgi:hypothetical protein